MAAVFERELRSYFTGLLGWIFVVFILVFGGIYTMTYNLNGGYSNFEYVLAQMSFIFIICIPLLTMRAIAEERHQHTDQLLYLLPVGIPRIVLGKFLAMLVVLALPVAVMCFYPLILSLYGAVSLKIAYSALFGFFCLGAALASMGLFISSLTDNQTIAAVVTLLFMLLNYFMTSLSGYIGSEAVASFIAFTLMAALIGFLLRAFTRSTKAAVILFAVLEAALIVLLIVAPNSLSGAFPHMISQLSLFDRFNEFVHGVFDLTAIIYDLSVMAIFLFLTIQAMEKRRWN